MNVILKRGLLHWCDIVAWFTTWMWYWNGGCYMYEILTRGLLHECDIETRILKFCYTDLILKRSLLHGCDVETGFTTRMWYRNNVYPQEMDPNGSPALGPCAFISTHTGSHSSTSGISLEFGVARPVFLAGELDLQIYWNFPSYRARPNSSIGADYQCRLSLSITWISVSTHHF